MQTEDLPLMRHLRISSGQLRRADARTSAWGKGHRGMVQVELWWVS